MGRNPLSRVIRVVIIRTAGVETSRTFEAQYGSLRRATCLLPGGTRVRARVHIHLCISVSSCCLRNEEAISVTRRPRVREPSRSATSEDARGCRVIPLLRTRKGTAAVRGRRPERSSIFESLPLLPFASSSAASVALFYSLLLLL